MSAMRIGLTGGIGSGKSTVASLLARLGAWVVDTDAISRTLTAPGGLGISPIRQAFGAQFITPEGGLDRAAMRALVFSDPQAKARLEALLHPLIQQQTLGAAAHAAAHQPVVFDVPLLVESAAYWRAQLDRILVVDCLPEMQIQRVTQRSGWQAQEVSRVIAQQASRAQRLAVADAVIDNSSNSLEALQAQVLTLWNDWFPPAES
jgi:dephospho-CoA kinase